MSSASNFPAVSSAGLDRSEPKRCAEAGGRDTYFQLSAALVAARAELAAVSRELALAYMDSRSTNSTPSCEKARSLDRADVALNHRGDWVRQRRPDLDLAECRKEERPEDVNLWNPENAKRAGGVIKSKAA